VKHGVKKWIEISTGQVYEADSKPSAENSKIKPWTQLAEAKLAAEEAVKKTGIKTVVLRLAVVYGPGDLTGVMPRLVCGATYTTGEDKMTFLWTKDLKFHTVHVKDVAAAIVHASTDNVAPGTYNIVDANDSDQGTIADFITALFGVETDFMGAMKSKLATAVAMKTVAATANETHLEPWSELCKKHNITATPLTPYLDEELLYKNAMALDGTAFGKTGFSCERPKVSLADIKESVQYWIDTGAFPKGLLK
jgi:nucleoside-diphosphate-sugar epimerase